MICPKCGARLQSTFLKQDSDITKTKATLAASATCEKCDSFYTYNMIINLEGKVISIIETDITEFKFC